MIPAKKPDNEAERLAELRDLDVLDTEPEARYDDLTRIASFICGTPIALVSLVDEDRQWFKSRHGLDATETPRDMAFCAHAILQDGLFVVPNALEDERFADNPLVAGAPDIRMYAGVPLETSGGRMGSLCVIDREARELTEDQKECLEALGRQVVAQLELHRDNRRLQQQEVDLHAANEKAQEANRLKSQFLANMSHEIRTPLNGVMGMIDLAMDTKLNREQLDFLTMAQRSSETLLTVINDILDFSKIEAGKLALDPHAFEVRDVIECMIATLALRAHEKGVELACRISPQLPTMLRADSLRLRQVLVNLVGNAIKFTSQGEVVVTIDGEALGNNKMRLAISVSDTGIGIAEDKQASIFEAFTQADGTTTREYGGTGLGLPIAVQLVKLMGGTLSLESTAGSGSTFAFDVEVEVPEDQADNQRQVTASLRGARVLIVDDNHTNRRILEDTMLAAGVVPTMAEGGARALAHLGRAAAAGLPFRLMITDLNMPGMDGLQLIEEIRAMAEFAELPVVVLSSGGDLADEARSRREQLRIGAWLMKPARQAALFDAMTEATATIEQAEADAGEFDSKTSLAGRRILVAEDNEINQLVIRAMLEKLGCVVEIAEHGGEAVAAFEKNAYDAILMDVRMPTMDGLDATRKIRELERATGTRLPIVAATANAMEGDREMCLEAGMDGYLSKPIAESRLLQELHPLLAGKPKVAGEPEAMAFDPERTAAGSDAQLLQRIVKMFLDRRVETKAKMRAAVESGDAKEIRDAAHRIKGMVGNFAADEAARAAAMVEEAAGNGDLDRVGGAVDELETELERLAVSLQAHLNMAQ